MATHTQEKEIKTSIEGYEKIIESLQEKIKSNNKEIDKFNKTIEQNLKQIEYLKNDNQAIITYLKRKWKI